MKTEFSKEKNCRTDTVFRRVSDEVRGLDPESLCFLELMSDFGVNSLTKGCLLLRTFLIESLKNPELAELDFEDICKEIARFRSEDSESVRRGLEYTEEVLWENCDRVSLARKYPDEMKGLSYHLDYGKFLRTLSDIMREKC